MSFWPILKRAVIASCAFDMTIVYEALKTTERVLYPAAHSGNSPLYVKEVEEALALIRQRETALG